MSIDKQDLPLPRRVAEEIIRRCRREVETTPKRIIRATIIPWLRWRYRFGEIGEGFQWGQPMRFVPGSRIGRYVYVGAGFESTGPVTIGDLSMVSIECKIVGADHLYDVVGTPTRLAFADCHKPTVIGADVWIGARAILMEGITIHDGAVVGAGAVVTKDVPSYYVVGGVPARPIRTRYEQRDLERHVTAMFSGTPEGAQNAAR